MKNFLLLIVGMAALFSVNAGYCQNDGDRSTTQAALDRKCEEARQVALAPYKQEVFQECMQKREDEAECQQEAQAYDGARAHRGPAFYDLPECVTAFNYREGKTDAE